MAGDPSASLQSSAAARALALSQPNCQGYTIAAMARSQKSLDYVKALLAKAGDKQQHGFYAMDATKKAEVDATFAKVAAELGNVSVLCTTSAIAVCPSGSARHQTDYVASSTSALGHPCTAVLP